MPSATTHSACDILEKISEKRTPSTFWLARTFSGVSLDAITAALVNDGVKAVSL